MRARVYMAGPVTIVSVLPGLGAGSRKYWALMMARITQQYAACTHGRAPSRIVALSRCAVVPLAGRLLGGMRTWVSVVGPRASAVRIAVRIPAPALHPCAYACRPAARTHRGHAYYE